MEDGPLPEERRRGGRRRMIHLIWGGGLMLHRRRRPIRAWWKRGTTGEEIGEQAAGDRRQRTRRGVGGELQRVSFVLEPIIP